MITNIDIIVLISICIVGYFVYNYMFLEKLTYDEFKKLLPEGSRTFITPYTGKCSSCTSCMCHKS